MNKIKESIWSNKKAEIATALLPLIALVLAVFAFYTFYSFDKNLTFNSGGLSQLVSNLEFNENYVRAQANLIVEEAVSSCPNCDSSVLKQKIIEIAAEKENLFRYEGAGNFYAKIRNSEFEVTKEDADFIFKIPGLFVEAKEGANQIRRDFDLSLKIS